MKHKFIKSTVFIFAITFVLTLISCTLKPNNSSSDSTAEENVPKEKEIYLPYTLLDHSENCKRTYYYNEYGNEIKTTKENLNGELLATWLYEYDENQNLIKRTVDTGDGTPFVQLIQIYDDKGNLLEQREYTTNGETVSTYQYDDQNRVISKKRGETVIETYIYAEDGSYTVQSASDPDVYRHYNKDGKITERHLTATTKVIYAYNIDGVLTEAVTYSGNDIAGKQVYQLDEHGNPIKVIQVSSSGAESVLGEYEYKRYTVKVK